MHREIEKDFFILNGTFYPVREFVPEKAIEYPSVYEVVRVIEGVPIFWEAHLDRMKKSVSLLGYDFPFDPPMIYAQLLELIEKNQVKNYNIKIVFNQLNVLQPNLYVFFITSHYPSTEQLKKGVPVILYEAERKNPHAKVISTDFRAPIIKAIRNADAYEALLVNNEGEVTEGSRSNFFIVKDGLFFTAPTSKVLEGVTRKCVFSLLSRLGYSWTEQPITEEFLQKADGLFLTGTSPGVLPVCTVGQQSFDSANIKEIQNIQGLYDHFVKTYVEVNKNSLHPSGC